MIIDNKSNFLYEIFEKKDIEELQILTPFITLYGFELIQKKLNSKTKILLSDSIDKILGISEELKYKNQLKQTYLAKKFADFIQKIEIKSTVQKSLSILNFINKEFITSIQGNFDLSLAGLGKVGSQNYYTNILVENEKQFLNIFNDLWNLPTNKDLKSDISNYLKKVYEEKTPEFLYFFTLYKIFENILDNLDEEKIINSKTGFKDTVIWNKLFNFQKDAVIGAIEKLEKYNGCIIADSVGLGKTFEALAVIKYYELKNNKVLVLTPKKLRENWNIYRVNDKRNILAKDRFNYDILNHTDLSREKGYSGEINLETINWGNYDLIVIDESHNFRNAIYKKEKKSRYQKLLEDIIKSGVKTKVLMLSATPVNNRLNDLKNQVALITEGNDKAFREFGIKSIEATLRIAQTKFNQWMKLPEKERTTKKLLEMLNFDYFKLLDLITIARSRKHIEKFYNTSKIGKFPQRLKPINIKTAIDDENIISIEEINNTISRLILAAYSPLKYLYPSKREEYAKKYDTEVGKGVVLKQIDREEALINLMRINLLKRMESSINSFNITIKKLIKKYENILEKIRNHKNIEEISIFDIDDIDEENIIGEKIKILIKDIDTIRWKQDLEEDLKLLNSLLLKTERIDTYKDNKLKNLKNIIENKINYPINPDNKKIIIFTAFADTAEYLYENISSWAKEKFNIESCLITGSKSNKCTLNIKKDMNNLLMNFSPISKERNKIDPYAKKEIDILIATDCISEGQNLQDCDYLINYDIHWNPVRIIQRFGRIDRIGSKNEKIQLVNFWPDMELDEYINLENRVSGRMVLLDISATGDDNVINQEKATLYYRLTQLKELQEKVLDLEDIDGTISLTDLTLSNFKMDLIEYLKVDPHLPTYPTGIHSTLLSNDNKGIIFCVKLLKEEKSNYPLHPYYFIYVDENNEIKLNFSDTKMILDLYKSLTFNKALDEKAISLLKEKTKDYKNMDFIVEKLKIAINSIIEKKEEVGIKSIFNRGEITLSNEFKTFEDFEIISFLVMQ
jgi:hypothetical protein